MIFSWLTQQRDATKVIVFFNGWGIDKCAIEHLTLEPDTDLLFVSDYTTIDTKLPNLANYQQRYLVAWSFGVANYCAWQANYPDTFDKKIAINGTIQGIDRDFGIAQKIVEHTINTLSIDSYREFISRCYNGINNIQKEHEIAYEISEAELGRNKIELEQINIRRYPTISKIKWDSVWISNNDMIFPSKNQTKAWQGVSVQLIDAAHAPFDNWSNWQELLI